MSRVITFSRTYPIHHPRKGQPTFFVEKVLNCFGIDYQGDRYLQTLLGLNTRNLMLGKLTFEDIESFHISLQPVEEKKSHTIRASMRFKAGNYFSPRCWFGVPYHSPQIILTPDMKIKKDWNFDVREFKDGYWIDFGSHHIPPYEKSSHSILPLLSRNDGLDTVDFLQWFGYPKEFNGQIICWNENINY